MSTRDKAEWALAVYEKTIRDSMATHYLNDNATEDERHAARQAVHDAREQALSCLCPTPPAPGEVTVRLSQDQAGWLHGFLSNSLPRIPADEAVMDQIVVALDAALDAAAAPETAR